MKKLFSDYVLSIKKDKLTKFTSKYEDLYVGKTVDFGKEPEEFMLEFDNITLKFIKCLKYNDLQELNKLLKLKRGIEKKDLTYHRLFVLNQLIKYDFIYKEGEKYHFYDDVRNKMIHHLKSKLLLKKSKLIDKEYAYVSGIMNIYGSLSLDEFIRIYNTSLSRPLKNYMELIKRYIVLYKEIKLTDKIIYKRTIKNAKEASALLKDDNKTYNEKLIYSYGKRDFKFNTKYKSLIKYIKRKYRFTDNALNTFKNEILSPAIDYYKMNEENAKRFLEINLKEKFEFSNDKLYNNLIKKIFEVAKAEISWK